MENQSKDIKNINEKLKDELTKIQYDLIEKQADFEAFNIKIENSLNTDKNEIIKNLEENINNINDKYKKEQKENINLKEINDKLFKENNERMKIIEEYKIKLNKLEEENHKLKESENKNKIIKDYEEKINEINEINNDLNDIKIILNNEIKEVKRIKFEIDFLENQDKTKNDFNKNPNASEKKIIRNELNIYKSQEIKIQNDNKINIINNIQIYSYECINKDKLVLNIKEGMEEGEIRIGLKNNGNITWKKDTKLKMVDPSDIKIDDISLNQQEPNEVEKYTIVFKQLNNLSIKEYITRLVFCSEGKNYGEIIILKINVLNEDDYNQKKVDEFRESFNLPEKDYSNEDILTALKDNYFIFESTITSLFN